RRSGEQSCASWRKPDGLIVSEYRTQREAPGIAARNVTQHSPDRGPPRFEHAPDMGRSDRGSQPSSGPRASIAGSRRARNVRERVRSCRKRARRSEDKLLAIADEVIE